MYDFKDLAAIVEKLRSPEGCLWDREQTYESLKACLQSEVQEVFDAIDHGDMENLCEELGDLLFHVMIYSQMAKEEGAFCIEDVVDGVSRKMIRRHPHVFGDAKASTPEECLELWRAAKALEKEEKALTNKGKTAINDRV